MAAFSTVSVFVVLIIACAAGVQANGIGSTFSDENLIRQVVSDGLHELETSVLKVIGQTRHALTFARFAHRSHNKKGLSYTLGVNEFADMTWEEFSKQKLGAAQHCSATRKGNHKLTNAVLPLTQDWRKVGIVSPVKNQGSCGSCWTFSTTGALEAAYAQAYGKSVSLSEQQLVDCAGDFNNFGCNGGLPSQAYEYIKYNGGLDTEEAYPYTGEDGVCKYSSENAAVRVLDAVNITMVISTFRLYTGGVFTSDVCGSDPMMKEAKCVNDFEQDVNHAVVAVGYGVEDGVPYWLIKNSWGAEWGLNGYFKMEMGKNMCGVATCASYPIVA
ncbi:Cysteine peptidase, asparagine active site-containing protein [Cynara cardunculus var. scolymus]|uniref:Cysteine peptidase, asparagine active site-containing protein n=1 Tax=Cynara cardunculus var. scolymus TaxID=59895 RepID=A0A118JVM8_CYNCS|nr:Cysteine peptidase, asparagine active site-containing protein [Cynara cardunculus var. scolymus]